MFMENKVPEKEKFVLLGFIRIECFTTNIKRYIERTFILEWDCVKNRRSHLLFSLF